MTGPSRKQEHSAFSLGWKVLIDGGFAQVLAWCISREPAAVSQPSGWLSQHWSGCEESKHVRRRP